MSLVINIYYQGENGNARRFAQEMIDSGLVDQVRQEAGNESYAYFFPLDDPETVLLIDKWHDQEALDAHHRSQMMPAIAALREKYHLKMRVERYTEYDQ